MSTRVLITGITGFIGSNIGKKLVELGYDVYATYRSSSSFERCAAYINKISKINIDEDNWVENIISHRPNIFIHVAWSGIVADERDDWDKQLENFYFSRVIFDIASKCNADKIISFGSQAEYGIYDSEMKEEYITRPTCAYGSVKILTMDYLRILSKRSNSPFYWLRIFSVFGEGEDERMLIPYTIKKLLNKEKITLTKCEQIYNYLYIDDFINKLVLVLQSSNKEPGIYNICSEEHIVLKDLLITIADKLGIEKNYLLFGYKRYRENQSMNILGSLDKFSKTFGVTSSIGIKSGIDKIINFHKKNESI